jgi:hypothetical protein
MIRRSVSDPEEVAFYLSNAGEKAVCSKLAKVAATRFNIEMCFKLGKGETGLDHYEVRHYHSWYRHITLSMMALAWLVVTKHRLMQAEAETDPQKSMLAPLTVPEVRKLLKVFLQMPEPSVLSRLAWSAWRRAKRYLAKASHYLSRLRDPNSPAREMFPN